MKCAFLLLSFSMVMGLAASAQTSLPLKEWDAGDRLPFVLYVSGDGGFNDFSTGLCVSMNKQGYAVTALNAKSYFWNKKTPDQTAADISSVILKKLGGRMNQQFVLVGYSFGADIMPFVVNRLPPALKGNLVSVVLLSPSASTDFEVHWADFFVSNKKRNLDVIAEMNKMQLFKTVTLIGVEETHFPATEIKLKNYTNEHLPGGHNFDGHSEEVAAHIIRYFR